MISAAGSAGSGRPSRSRAKALNSESTSTDSCIKDEREAKFELENKWSSYDAQQRRQCSQEISIGGSPSYVELLACIQMKDWSKLPASTTATAPAR